MKTLNVAVIGAAGWIGGVHSECLNRLKYMIPSVNIRLHTAVDVFENQVKDVARMYGFEHWSLDYSEVINNKEIDIIDICCNNNFHREIAVKAAAAGKAILCEKPLAMSVEDAQQMVDAVKKYNVINCCDFIYRKYPGVAYIKQMIDEGQLGEVYYIKAYFEQDSHFDPLDMHAWLFSKKKAGGGSIVTNGSHVIDICRYLMGDFVEVAANSQTYIKERPKVFSDQMSKANSQTFIKERPKAMDEVMENVDVDDVTSAMIRFKNGGMGVLLSSWLTQGKRHSMNFEIVCSNGTVCFDSQRLNEVRLCEGGTARDKIGFKDILIGNEHPYGAIFNLKTGMGIGAKESFTIMIKEFIEAVIQNKPMYPNFEDGLIACQYLQKIQQAAEESKWIKI